MTQIENPRQFLQALFQVAVETANPHQVLAPHLPADTNRRAVVIGAGKAAAAMASALEQHWCGELSGLVVTRYGHAEPCKHIEVVEASHPVPDDEGEKIARRILERVSDLDENDLVICLLSGGGSSLLSLPASGISLADKQDINRQLLKSGAAIDEINCVRKHLSQIKGGQLARACMPAQLITYAISDVPGDHPAVIASGPTVADDTTSAQALEIIQRHGITIASHIKRWLHSSASETLKTGHEAFTNSEFHLIATPQQSLQAAAARAVEAGVHVLQLGDRIDGEASEVARAQAAIALGTGEQSDPITPPCLILSGGETTVTLKGQGRGGRNAEFLLSLATTLTGAPNIYAIAADTDGIDGSQDNAGALLCPDSWQRALDAGLDARAMLANSDSYSFFSALGDLLITGPTRTNVNDFRAILVLP